jgi:hypothetical protein
LVKVNKMLLPVPHSSVLDEEEAMIGVGVMPVPEPTVTCWIGEVAEQLFVNTCTK